jgi:hypothetical protein
MKHVKNANETKCTNGRTIAAFDIPRSRPSSREQALQRSLLDMYPQRYKFLCRQANRRHLGENWGVMVRTLRLLRRADLVFHLERLARVDDVDYRAGPRRL